MALWLWKFQTPVHSHVSLPTTATCEAQSYVQPWRRCIVCVETLAWSQENLASSIDTTWSVAMECYISYPYLFHHVFNPRGFKNKITGLRFLFVLFSLPWGSFLDGERNVGIIYLSPVVLFSNQLDWMNYLDDWGSTLFCKQQ